MKSVLSEICNKKRLHVEKNKSHTSLDTLKSKIKTAEAPRGFLSALKEKPAPGAPAFITEVKKASPSKGVIRAEFNPVDIAKIYETNGATCLSVLTDEPYFQGHDDYLVEIKKAVLLPLLRKDFMIDEYQIYESRALGADCVLLIMACLSDDEARSFYDLSKNLGMDVLVEINDEEELKRTKLFSPDLIGINNRNLKTLAVDVQTSFDLVEKISGDFFKVSESGLSDADTIKRLQTQGFGAFLIGESLMRQNDIASALKALSA